MQDKTRRRSPRELLEELAGAAALEVEGVVALAPDRTGRSGARATAQADGGYGVALSLTIELVPVDALVTAVRNAVTAAAAKAGLSDELGPIDIEIADVTAPGERA